MAQTAAHKARAMRQETLREYLSNQGLLSHVVDIADKIQKLEKSEDSAFELQKLKASAEIKLKLINKYLGDEKTVETFVNDARRGPDEYTDEELENIAAGRSPDSPGTQESQTKLH